MKASSHPTPPARLTRWLRSRRGSMITLVLIMTAGISLVLGSVLSLGITEKKNNMRHILKQEARNAAESFVEYGFADLMERFRKRSAVGLVRSSLASDPIKIPAAATSFYSGSNIDLSQCELYVGEIPDAATEVYIDPSDPSNEYDPLKGKRAYIRRVELIAKAVATSPQNGGMSSEAYARQVLEIRDSPLFAHAIFYNMDLELHPGPVMKVFGPVHTNTDFWLEASSGIKFYGTISSSGRILHGYKRTSVNPDGSLKYQNDHTQQGSVQIVNSTGSFKDMYDGGSRSSDSGWLDHRDKNWRALASQRWDGYVQDTSHGVPILNPVGIEDYVPLNQSVLEDELLNSSDPDSRINVIQNHAYALIEPVLAEGHPNYKGDAVRQEKYAYKAGLILKLVEQEDAATTHPYYANGWYSNTSAGQAAFAINRQTYYVKAYKYQRNAEGDPVINSSGYPVMTEVRLPKGLIGAVDSTMRSIPDDKNGLLEPYKTTVEEDEETREKNEANNSTKGEWQYVWNGYQWKWTWVENEPFTKSNNYNPTTGYVVAGMYDHREDKALDMLSLNVKRLCELVDNTDNHYSPDDWKDHYGPDTAPDDVYTPADDWNGIIYVQFPVNTHVTGTTAGDDVNFEAGTRVRYDGIVIGKDPFVALQIVNGERFPRPTFAEEKGLTVATNGPLYTIGNMNANGVAHSDDANLPDNNMEPPASFASDTLTVLSPRWYPNSGNNRRYSNEGNLNHRKASYTEFSAAILTGLKPTIPQYSPNMPSRGAISGGAHNFPRFLEHWDPELTIRGSLVALFESEVHRLAMPNNSGHFYEPPNRDWGFNENFRNGNYPPGTPNTRTYRRVSLQDIPRTSHGSPSDPDYREGFVQAKSRMNGGSS